jgi:DNA-binding PucR family transcriptional regulator
MIILDRIDESDRSPADIAAIDAGLMKLCRDHNLQMASSREYEDYQHLNLAYNQTVKAIQLTSDEQSVVCFRDEVSAVMVSELALTGQPEWFCHSAVLRLNDDVDLEHRLLDTLLTYLMRGNNESATADALGVTRVTVSKRIAKLREILDMDLDAVTDQIKLHLALSCSIIRNSKEK